MERKNNSMRDRLLANMPQPENLAAYREETAALLAKHEKALFWERMGSWASYGVAAVMLLLWLLKLTPAPGMQQYFWPFVGFAYFAGVVGDLRYRFYLNKVDILKELKQVQLQVLELQAAQQKDAAN
jgi:hypothetical protein